MTPRRTARGLTGLALLTLALAGFAMPAGAATTTVVVDNMAFSPRTVTVTLGNSVTWSFKELHTSTSNQGFWNSGQKSSGTYVKTFLDAGSYAYHCTLHSDMTGTVRVPVKASGTSAQGYTVRWSTRTSTPSSRRYDVQYKKVGATSWTTWRSSTSSRSAFFNPSSSASYYVHARTRIVGGSASGWSPSITVKIT
jgi:plastocyanin